MSHAPSSRWWKPGYIEQGAVGHAAAVVVDAALIEQVIGAGTDA